MSSERNSIELKSVESTTELTSIPERQTSTFSRLSSLNPIRKYQWLYILLWVLGMMIVFLILTILAIQNENEDPINPSEVEESTTNKIEEITTVNEFEEATSNTNFSEDSSTQAIKPMRGIVPINFVPVVEISSIKSVISTTTAKAIIECDDDYCDPLSDSLPQSFDDLTPETTTSKACKFSSHKNYHKFPQNCGLLPSIKKVQNGVKADLFQHPWIIAMFASDERDGSEMYFCGGSLIRDDLVLTAAHCNDFPTNIIMSHIRVGEYNVTSELDCVIESNGATECADPVQIIPASDLTFIPHPDFSNKTGLNDIALIKLKNPVKRSKSVVPICLPFDTPEVPSKLEIIGFGIDTQVPKLHFPEVLMTGFVNLVDRESCLKEYENITKNGSKEISENNFCAIGIKKIHENNSNLTDVITACGGDSGSPVLWVPKDEPTTRTIQYGLISWGEKRKCGNKTKSGVFTKVHSYLSWILENSD